MNRYTLMAPCHFGLEAVLKKEIQDIGYDPIEVMDGRIIFAGDEEAIARVNIESRVAERIMIKIGDFEAKSFEELFDKTKALPWEDYIPKNGRCWVKKASGIKSALYSPSDIQSIMKKAIADRLMEHYDLEHLPEDGADYPLRVSIYKDRVLVGLDTTGDSLHKRGYRKMRVQAPIAENLAAGIIKLTPWKEGRILVDPFCGSGTFPIEAALIAANAAPGMNREFTAMDWGHIVKARIWNDAFEEARENADFTAQADIQGYDIDEAAINAARENARLAGVEHMIHFQKRDVSELSHAGHYGFIITNPPYGERLESEDDQELKNLYRTLGERFAALSDWSLYLITALEDARKYIGRIPGAEQRGRYGKYGPKNRKLYNGMMKTYLYQYAGPRPGRDKL